MADQDCFICGKVGFAIWCWPCEKKHPAPPKLAEAEARLKTTEAALFNAIDCVNEEQRRFEDAEARIKKLETDLWAADRYIVHAEFYFDEVSAKADDLEARLATAIERYEAVDAEMEKLGDLPARLAALQTAPPSAGSSAINGPPMAEIDYCDECGPDDLKHIIAVLKHRIAALETENARLRVVLGFQEARQ